MSDHSTAPSSQPWLKLGLALATVAAVSAATLAFWPKPASTPRRRKPKSTNNNSSNIAATGASAPAASPSAPKVASPIAGNAASQSSNLIQVSDDGTIRINISALEPLDFLSSAAAASAGDSAASLDAAIRELFAALTTSSASASGKALVTGGYLVLEQKFSGLVFALSAKFHARIAAVKDLAAIQSLATPSPREVFAQKCFGFNPMLDDGWLYVPFLVHSPQRSSAMTEYWVAVRLPENTSLPCGANTTTLIRRAPDDSEANPFVESALYVCVHFFSSLLPFDTLRRLWSWPVVVDLEADHPFYSAAPPTGDGPLPPDSKTGLGSSAALVSSLVAALFQFMGVLNGDSGSRSVWLPVPASAHEDDASQSVMGSSFTVINTDLSSVSTRPLLALTATAAPASHVRLTLTATDWFAVCHHMSQLIHCVAQGKVGSGFDVSAAFHGSHRYTRFAPEVISGILSAVGDRNVERCELVKCALPSIKHEQHNGVTVANANADSRSEFDSDSETALSRTPSPLTPSPCSVCRWLDSRHPWDHDVRPIQLPSFLHLHLADVRGGAKTPALVKTVLAWRSHQPNDSERLWSELAIINDSIEKQIRSLKVMESQQGSEASFADEIRSLATSPVSEWDVETHSPLAQSLLSLASSFTTARTLIRSMGAASGADIEPRTQTELCDKLTQQAGVLAAGVPGAGGEDAIFILAFAAGKISWQSSLPSRVSLLPIHQRDEPIECITAARDWTNRKLFRSQ